MTHNDYSIQELKILLENKNRTELYEMCNSIRQKIREWKNVFEQYIQTHQIPPEFTQKFSKIEEILKLLNNRIESIYNLGKELLIKRLIDSIINIKEIDQIFENILNSYPNLNQSEEFNILLAYSNQIKGIIEGEDFSTHLINKQIQDSISLAISTLNNTNVSRGENQVDRDIRIMKNSLAKYENTIREMRSELSKDNPNKGKIATLINDLGESSNDLLDYAKEAHSTYDELISDLYHFLEE